MLKSKIKSIVEARGLKYITNPLLVNELADYKAYEECIPAKFILKIIIEEEYADALCHLIEIGSYTDTVAKRIVEDLYSKFGFRRDLIILVVNSLLYALGFSELPLDNVPSPSNSSNDNSLTDGNGTHITFSGISLDHSLNEIENHLQSRGFKTVKSKLYQIQMAGTFCEINDVKLYINGSPFGVTKNIVVSMESNARCLYFNWGNDLYKLIRKKYGEPCSVIDPLDTIDSDFDHYCKNILKYHEKEEHYEDILSCIWQVKGGKIELWWTGDHLNLTYTDTENTNSVEVQQHQLNLESI